MLYWRITLKAGALQRGFIVLLNIVHGCLQPLTAVPRCGCGCDRKYQSQIFITVVDYLHKLKILATDVHR